MDIKKGQQENLINNMPDGFAYFQVVVNEKNELVDNVCLQINPAFSKITGLTKEKILGQKVSAIYPGITTLGIDWRGIYSQLVDTGKPIELEHYFALFEKWFAVTAYLDQPQHVAVIVKDINERKQMEENLKQEQQEKELILCNLAEQVAFIDPEMRIIWANSKIVERHNLHNVEYKGQKCFKLYHQFDQPCPDCPVVEAFKTGKTCSGVHQSPDNIYWQVTGIPVHDQTGEVIGVMDTALDVTDLITSRQELQENYALLRLAGKTAKFGGWSVDLKANKCTWSDQVALIHDLPIGYSPLIEEGVNFYTPEWRERITVVFTACAEEGIPYDEEMEIVTAKGRRVWVRTVGEAVRDDKGNIVRVQGSFQDITDKQKMLEKIRKEQMQLLSIFNNIDEMIYIADPDSYEVLFVNRKLADTLEKDTVGKICFEVFQGLDTPCDFCTNSIIKANKREPYYWEYYNPLLNKHFKLYDRLIRWPDGREVRFEMAADITELKNAENEIYQLNSELEQRVKERTVELEAVNKELESFAYSVSHDFRAPLRALDGFSASLTDKYNDQLDEQGLHYLNRIRNAAIYMSNLVDDLLKLSRVTRTEIKKDRVNLSKLAVEVLAELQESEPTRKVEASIAANLTAKGDPHLMRVALENLIGNAWKFSSQEPQAEIEVGQTVIDEEKVFFVGDNGVGFNMAYADKLFGAFQRLHGVNEFPGTGIGLATVQRIINRHGGRIWAESEVGRGSTFYFTLKK